MNAGARLSQLLECIGTLLDEVAEVLREIGDERLHR